MCDFTADRFIAERTIIVRIRIKCSRLGLLLLLTAGCGRTETVMRSLTVMCVVGTLGRPAEELGLRFAMRNL